MEQAVSPGGIGANLAKLQDTSTDAQIPSQHDSSSTQEASLSGHSPEVAKRYARTKISLGILGTLVFFALTLVLVATGATRAVEDFVRSFVSNNYIALLAFAAVLGSVEIVAAFPLRLYSGFLLEHKYNLSNQSFPAWVWEGAKGMFIGLLVGTPILLGLYYCLRTFGDSWWLPVGAIFFFVSVVLARVAPVLIFPLFYRFRPVADGEIKDRLVKLCRMAGMSVKGVFVFDMSKSTKKANAAFAGIGRSRRIILGDTLIANFMNEEIETIVAHELGHFKLRHVWAALLVGTVNTFLGLYVTGEVYGASVSWFGFSAIDQLAALPLLGFWLGVYSLVTGPVSNMISRSHERAADRFAVLLSGKKESFVNALRKLAVVNLSDTSPHPVVEFLFHSHPSIEKRIRAIECISVDVKQ